MNTKKEIANNYPHTPEQSPDWFVMVADGGQLCMPCVRTEAKRIEESERDCGDDDQWRVIGAHHPYLDSTCDHCDRAPTQPKQINETRTKPEQPAQPAHTEDADRPA